VDWALRVAVGLVISGVIGVAARRQRILTVSGAWAALLVGTTLFAGGGWTWLVLVGAFFATSSILTRWHPRSERTRQRSLDATGRRWDQVAANGGIAALAAAIHGFTGWPLAFGAAAGAIGAATADTWATELGRWSPSAPRLITTWRVVSHGTSGGMTILGTSGALAGALLIGGVASALAHGAPGHPGLLAVVLAGFSGATVDSLLGATVEERFRWVNGSVVNLLATAWGAGIMLAASR
jgi:uncharacterized protein (TIGR00297 family)